MGASISGIAILVFDPEGGRIRPARLRVAQLERNFAVDGDGAVIGATNADAQMIRTVVEITGSMTTVVQMEDRYAALVGTQVTIVDQFGSTWNDVLIMDVVTRPSAKAGFASTWRLEARWKILVPTDT